MLSPESIATVEEGQPLTLTFLFNEISFTGSCTLTHMEIQLPIELMGLVSIVHEWHVNLADIGYLD